MPKTGGRDTLTQLAFRARILTLALMILVVTAGAYSVTRLPVELFPDIDFPLVTVATFYPQSPSDQVLQEVTVPLERAIEGVPNVTTVSSTSSPSLSLLLVQAPFGVDMKAMERDIAQRVGLATLPAGIPPPRVARINPDEFPVLEISVLGNHDLADLQALIQAQVLPELKAVPGVFSADLPLGSGAGLSLTRTNGVPSLAISVLKEPDANTVKMSKAVIARLDSLKASLPPDLQFVEISNQAPGIEKSINELKQEVLLGALLAVLVIFAFLLSVRPTLVTSVSIPVSILAALWVMNLQGMTLNILTLGGLAVAVGRVVDDSIVTMENIYRHVHLGQDRRTAAINGTREVAVPIITSTLTTIAVFAPLGFIGGFIGLVFLPFALTITYALLASLLVALTVVPILGSMLITQGKQGDGRQSPLVRRYGALLGWSLAHKGRTLLVAAALLLLALGAIPLIPLSFLPSSSQPLLSVEMSVPGATSADAVVQQLDQVEVVLSRMRRDGVVNVYQSTIGNSGGFGRGTGRLDTASIYVLLGDGVDAEQVADTLRRDLADPGRSLTVSQADGGGPQSNALQLTLRGEDYPLLAATATQITQALQDMPGLINVRNDAVVSAGPQTDAGQLPITRVDGQTAITISGTITDPSTQAIQRQVQQRVDQVGLPAGVQLVTGGVFANFNEAFSQMGIAMVLGVALVYLVMVVSQRSLVTPFVILFSLPLASIGALGGLLVTQRTLGLPALIGLLMLIGLVVTNAIVLVAFVEQLRARGLGLIDALVQGGRTRLRPILMTALTTVFVLMPLAVGLGGDSEGLIGAELATVVIGGLLTSTLLTLVVVPIIYSILRKAPRRARAAETSFSSASERRGPSPARQSGEMGDE
ncbi:MAG: efflux RND transporter permease subunit [Chloroflexi bacterium]|nr:efflux RND transporter permease subunit [Chloroflexota bacterium]